MFKTVADPSSIRSKRTERNVVTRIATTGMDVLELTLLRYLHPGRPRSRANDHVIRDEVATSPMVERKVNARIIALMAVVPLVELLLWRKT